EAMQLVLPGEADPAEDLDRDLADGNCALCRIGLRGGGCQRRLRVSGRDAPRGPERERSRQLEPRVCVRERVRYGLVYADLLPELLACRGVLESVFEGAPGGAASLEGERGQ